MGYRPRSGKPLAPRRAPLLRVSSDYGNPIGRIADCGDARSYQIPVFVNTENRDV
jgi:hypothetical protein